MKAEQDKVRIVYETAARIRLALDEARKAYGAEAWDDDDIQTKVLDLVTEEEE